MRGFLRAIGRVVYFPFYAVAVIVRSLLRALIFVIHILYDILYYGVHLYGHPVVPVIIIGVFFYVNRNVRPGATFHDMGAEIPFTLLVGFVGCKVMERHFRPWPHTPRKPKAPPKPKGLPVVTGASGRSDDPTEGLIVDRLPLHLQALLVPAKSPSRSSPAANNGETEAAE